MASPPFPVVCLLTRSPTVLLFLCPGAGVEIAVGIGPAATVPGIRAKSVKKILIHKYYVYQLTSIHVIVDSLRISVLTYRFEWEQERIAIPTTNLHTGTENRHR